MYADVRVKHVTPQPMEQFHGTLIISGLKMCLKLLQGYDLETIAQAKRRTSNPLINGEIVSGNSGATDPRSFQLLDKPLLIALACEDEFVTLNRIAMELASCGQRSLVVLSRYMPRLSSQNASLNLVFRRVAFEAHAEASLLSFTYWASSDPVVRTYIAMIAKVKLETCSSELTLYNNALPSELCPPVQSLPQSLKPVTFISPEASTLFSKNCTAFV